MPKTILVVDDRRVMRTAISLILEGRGYQIVTAENGEDAIEKLQQPEQSIDLVVTDANMPKIDGFQLTQYVKYQYKIPVIMVSGRDDNREPAEQAGADYFLEKTPRLFTELTETIEQALEEQPTQ